MGSYSIDNVTATQGRYADVVATSKPVQVKNKVMPESNNRKSDNAFKVKNKEFLAENSLDKNESVDEKVFGSAEEQKAKEELMNDEEQMNSITETLNKFMAQWNAHLKFAVHKETEMLTVKFVDMKNNKVLKEFPPEEYLDMIAKIRKFIGAMIDEKV